VPTTIMVMPKLQLSINASLSYVMTKAEYPRWS
jgi:hypothetical protein